MRTYLSPPPSEWSAIVRRPLLDQQNMDELMAAMLESILRDGDEALREYTRRYDGVELEDLEIDQDTLQEWAANIDEELELAIERAYANIEMFHRSQQVVEGKVETMPGVECWRKALPLERVGLYVPGGSAPLFSSVLMLAIPAKIAGCDQVVLCTPPDKRGEIHPAVAYCALRCGVSKVYRVGGAQAVLAMACGTKSIERVDKILGPGNQYVTAAKQKALQLGVAIDMPAGPSEVMVVGDDSSNPAFVASDLLSQAEHGPDSHVVFLSRSEDMILRVRAEVERQLDRLPRKQIAKISIDKGAYVYLSEKDACVDFMNLYAPEHLILALDDASDWIDDIRHAGSVFVGHYSPESVGDYASGTNHTLPTYGYARIYSGVSVDTYQKKTTFQQLSPQGLLAIGPSVEVMARAESLEAHSRAVSIRIMTLEENTDKVKK